MSGGEILVVPVGLVLVPIAMAAAGVGMAAALAIRAAQAGTEATGRALAEFAAEMERKAGAQDDLAIRTRLWELAAGSVVRTNQDLRLLAARAEKAGVRLTVPRPIDLTGCRLADTRGLVAQAQEALAGMRAAVEQAEAARERGTLLAKLPVPPGGSPTAADMLARYQEVLAARQPWDAGRQIRTETAPPKVDEARVRAEIEAILGRLDVDATADERATVLTAAARTEQQRNPTMSRTYLDALARVVDEKINPRVLGRREAAHLLAAIEQPLVAEVIEELAPPRPPCFDAIERLRAVVRGDAELTDANRRDGRSVLGWVQSEMERRRLLDTVAEAFGRLGYAVTAGLQVHHSPAVSVTRPDWRGGHAADVWIDEAGRVRSRLIQLDREAGGEAGRCEDLNGTLRHVGQELDRRGIGARVDLPSPPLPALRRFENGLGSTTSTAAEDGAPIALALPHPEEDR